MSERRSPILILVLQKLMQPERQAMLQNDLCKTLFCDHIYNKQRDAKLYSDSAAIYSRRAVLLCSNYSLQFRGLRTYCDAVIVKTAQQEKPAVVMEHKTFWHDSRRIPSVGRPAPEAASDLVSRAVLQAQSLSLLIQFITLLRAGPSFPASQESVVCQIISDSCVLQNVSCLPVAETVQLTCFCHWTKAQNSWLSFDAAIPTTVKYPRDSACRRSV